MSTQPFDSGRVPEWTRGDYLRKARVAAGMSVKDLAAATGISEKTINNYEADRHAPRRPSLMAWALATGVPLSWIESGQSPTDDQPPTPPNGGGRLTPSDDLARLTASKRARAGGGAHNHQYVAAA